MGLWSPRGTNSSNYRPSAEENAQTNGRSDNYEWEKSDGSGRNDQTKTTGPDGRVGASGQRTAASIGAERGDGEGPYSRGHGGSDGKLLVS